MDNNHFAQTWIEAWNQRQINTILEFYADNLRYTSPKIIQFMGIASGTLLGKASFKEFVKAVLDKMPELKFELIDLAEGVESTVIYYRSSGNKQVIEVINFNKEGKIHKVHAHYTA